MYSSFFDTLEEKFNIRLNEQQKAAVLHKDGPAIILAVPGAGKTTTLICRTANLIKNHNIDPSSILSITFSKASAKDMKERFCSIFGHALGSQVTFMTIHSFAYYIIREYAYIAKNKYSLIEGEGSPVNKIQIIKGIYYEVNKAYINDDKLEELLSSIGYIKNMMISIDDIKNHSLQFKNLEEIYGRYEDYKKKNGYIDFDDMLTFSLEILKNNPQIVSKYRSKYKYIQLDEGQDTSKVQNEIIKTLVYPNNNLFVVADDDQSIYGFRGAYPEALLSFSDIYPNSSTFYMEENFRSTKNIVSVCNDFICSNKVRFKKNLFTNNESKRPVTIVRVKDELEQYNYVLEEIQKSKDLASTAILFRNNISSIGLIEVLNNHRIPFYMRDSKLHFFNHWVTQDILSFMKLSIDGTSTEDFERIYYKMKGYISKASMNYAILNIKDKDIFDTLIKYPELKPFQIENLRRLKSDFKKLSKKSPTSAINFIENDLEYGIYLKDNCKTFGYSYDNIKSILSILKTISLKSISIVEFLAKLQHLQNLIQRAKLNRGKNVVTLSTIHGAKGLEFSRVYMVDLIEGDFPSSSSIEMMDIGETSLMEEERRLFYVGMTRAKEVLDIISLSHVNNDRVFPSRFIGELEKIVGPIDMGRAKNHEKFSIGSKVKHKKFGLGKVRHIHGDSLIIDFENGQEKLLSMDLCVEKKLLTIP